MAVKKVFYYSQKQMQAADFERALAFTRVRENTVAIARAYLVTRFSLDTIASQFDTSKQNVFRAVQRILQDAEIAQNTIARIKPIFRKLNIEHNLREPAREFFFTSASLEEIAKRTGVTVDDVLKAAKSAIKCYQHYVNKAAIRQRQVAFEKILPYARAGEKSLQIAYDYFVFEEPLTGVAEKHEVTKQNAYNIIKRFEEAKARYEQANTKKARRSRSSKT